MIAVVTAVAGCGQSDEKETIVFSNLNWTSAQVQNRIAQYLVEKGYDYPTDLVFGATVPLFQGLRGGDTQVTMEIWLPNQDGYGRRPKGPARSFRLVRAWAATGSPLS